MAISVVVVGAMLSWLSWPLLLQSSRPCCRSRHDHCGRGCCGHHCCGCRGHRCHSCCGHVVAVVVVVVIVAIVTAIVVAVFVAIVPLSWPLSSLHHSHRCRSCCCRYCCHRRRLCHHIVVVSPLKGEWVGGRFLEHADDECQTAKDD